MLVLDRLTTTAKQETAKNWRRYRALLEKANAAGGELLKNDQAELGDLIAALDLTTADARRHADALRAHATATAKAALLVEAQNQQKTLEQQVAEFSLRYQNAIAPLELEGARLAATQQDLQARISGLLWQAGKKEQIENENPELFAVPPTPPHEPPLKSVATMQAEARLDELRQKGESARALFRDGGFGPDTRDEYKEPFYAALELGLVDCPDNCRAELEADFPRFIARQIRRKERSRDSLPPMARQALEAAISDGRIDGDTLKQAEVTHAAR
jgi:hypothetical protein